MNPIIVIAFISGFVIGMVIEAARVVANFKSGVFKIDEKNQSFLIEFDHFTLGDSKKKKWLLFKVDPDADLSETQK